MDAILGTGQTRPLTGLLATVADDVNATAGTVVAIDLPSGITSDLSRRADPCLRPVLTVTLGAPKLALALRPEPAGQVVVADIGIPAEVIAKLDAPRIGLLAAGEMRSSIPIRSPESHKGDFGRVAIVAGSRGKTGAACLAGLGALRAGAGLVTVATPASCLDVVAREPEYMTLGLPDENGVATGNGLDALLAGPWDVTAAGPGLGTGRGCRAIVQALLDRPERGPLVLDADALTVCAEQPEKLRGRPDAPVVITPASRRDGAARGNRGRRRAADRVGAAHRFAAEHGVHVVLKGARTVIAAPDGSVWVNTTGNPGMAKGGSGRRADRCGGRLAGAGAGTWGRRWRSRSISTAWRATSRCGRRARPACWRGTSPAGSGRRWWSSRAEAATDDDDRGQPLRGGHPPDRRELAAALEEAPAAVLCTASSVPARPPSCEGHRRGSGWLPRRCQQPDVRADAGVLGTPTRASRGFVPAWAGTTSRDLEPLLDEMLDGEAIVAIEWADRLRRAPEPAVRVRIADRGGNQRDDHRRETVTSRPAHPSPRQRRRPVRRPDRAAPDRATRSGSSALPW